jgi:hypothetical protein
MRFSIRSRYTESTGVKELAQVGSGMVPPLVNAIGQLLQVLDDSSVNMALPSIQDELAVTRAHLPWTVNAGWRDDGELQALQVREQHPQQTGLIGRHLVQHNDPHAAVLHASPIRPKRGGR